ncbi:hypothetical protein [Nocardioides sp. ChNu-99]|uniref:hypothetical protein n=1 Tax=Nocardioides sp. ChNu-99 TaxID=2839897 RepID=UPI0024071015|nr:hypothetical protein [Nocardioides sp. ChNu-99]MDF9717377.1 hypothetical protein [Nocardioides sp. ChNu-99]
MRIHFAKHHATGRAVPLEVKDRPPFTQEATGALVVVADQAWRVEPLVQHFMARFEVTEPKARELVAGYPHHRVHTHGRPGDA